MGRPFEQELSELPENIQFALAQPVAELTAAIEHAKGRRIFTCGAGGSFSAAAFAQLLFDETGFNAQTITPLYFLQTSRVFEPATLFLFTAGGRNKDVLRVIEHAHQIKVSVTLVCASKNSPAARLAGRLKGNRIFEFAYPAGRDGFLALNSLAVVWWLLARAFGHDVPDKANVRSLLGSKFDITFISPDRRHACLILHDRWTQPVAIDIESKLAEAALCAPLICDWRQFGHGRHHWFSKNAGFSSVLSISTGRETTLAERTLVHLPAPIPRVRLAAPKSTVASLCELLVRSFVLIGEIGKQVGIDPGRPGIPAFGSKLYHLSPPRATRRRRALKWDLEEGVARKLDAIGVRRAPPHMQQQIEEAASQFTARLRRANFFALVADFDGTLAPAGMQANHKLPEDLAVVLLSLLKKGLILGIATGRGDSCHNNLSASFPTKYWPQIHVCHYNGSSLGVLDDLIKRRISFATDTVLGAFADQLSSDKLLTSLADVIFKGPQITLRPKPSAQWTTVSRLAAGWLSGQSHLRLVSSSHTFDIVPTTTTKLRLVEHFRTLFPRRGEILTLGDRGDLAGNDFELLSEPYSLSVDLVSPTLRTCWNFLPPGTCNYDGSTHYLGLLRATSGGFRLTTR